MANTNKHIVERVNASFAEGETEVFLEHCKPEVVWKMVGEETRTGVDTIREFMASMGDMEPPKFSAINVIGEGDYVAATGDMTMKNKDGKTESYSFCDVYRFDGGKIAELTSYVVNTSRKGETAKA
ncbi:MAG TPA: nuclear transport factor 2 family protein [Pyrinomonadaceae bacterium]|nr:nuclear transport factor 2 family protein [Pyrinomonadaceae bacterium]